MWYCCCQGFYLARCVGWLVGWPSDSVDRQWCSGGKKEKFPSKWFQKTNKMKSRVHACLCNLVSFENLLNKTSVCARYSATVAEAAGPNGTKGSDITLSAIVALPRVCFIWPIVRAQGSWRGGGISLKVCRRMCAIGTISNVI